MVRKLRHIEQIVGNPAHNLADLGVAVIGVGKLLQVAIGVPAHIRLDPGAHDVSGSRHIIGGDTVHDTQQKVQTHHHANRAHGKGGDIPDSLICDKAHDHWQNQFAQGGQPRTGQVKNHGFPIGFKIRQKPSE